MERKFSQVEEKAARSRKTKDGHVVDNFKAPSEEGGHGEIIHGGKVYTASGKTGTDIRNRNAQATHYVAKEKIDDKKSKYHGQEVEKGLWVNQLGRVIEEDMKKFSEIVESKQILNTSTYPNDEYHAKEVGWGDSRMSPHISGDPKSRYVHHDHRRGTFRYTNKSGNLKNLREEYLYEELHLTPHGDKGTHYRVVKPVHTLKKGDVLSDSDVDALRDHYKVKHLKEEYSDEHIEEMEGKAFDAQHKEIKKHYGKEAADNANYGHGVGGDEHHTSIGTKVYGHGYVTTNICHKTGQIEHIHS